MTAYADVSSMLPFKKLHDTSDFPKKNLTYSWMRQSSSLMNIVENIYPH
jgi:hypothetical protein